MIDSGVQRYKYFSEIKTACLVLRDLHIRDVMFYRLCFILFIHYVYTHRLQEIAVLRIQIAHFGLLILRQSYIPDALIPLSVR